MSNYCGNCGARVESGLRFCPYCGAAQSSAPSGFAPAQHAGNASVPPGVPAPGFSDRANDKEILAAVKKNRKAGKIFAFFLVPLPLAGFIVYSLVSGKMELSKAALYGGIVSAVFLVFAIISLIASRAEKGYDAVVVDKSTRRVYRHRNGDDHQMITEYTTVVKTSDGKTKRITEREGSLIRAYSYLNIGDRFRFHPRFAFPYELYDKRNAPHIFCVGCGTKNPTSADRCRRCGLPLLK